MLANWRYYYVTMFSIDVTNVTDVALIVIHTIWEH